MKKIVFLFAMLVSLSMSAQVMQWRTSNLTMRHVPGEWGESLEVNCLVTYNEAKQLFEIYSKTPQKYSVVTSLPTKTGSSNQIIYQYETLDVDGVRTNITIAEFDDFYTFWITYNNLEYVYKMVLL